MILLVTGAPGVTATATTHEDGGATVIRLKGAALDAAITLDRSAVLRLLELAEAPAPPVPVADDWQARRRRVPGYGRDRGAGRYPQRA
jgi:hypothetical protein